MKLREWLRGVPGGAMCEVPGGAMCEVPGGAMCEVPGGAMCEVMPVFRYTTRIRNLIEDYLNEL